MLKSIRDYIISFSCQSFHSKSLIRNEGFLTIEMLEGFKVERHTGSVYLYLQYNAVTLMGQMEQIKMQVIYLSLA